MILQTDRIKNRNNAYLIQLVYENGAYYTRVLEKRTYVEDFSLSQLGFTAEKPKKLNRYEYQTVDRTENRKRALLIYGMVAKSLSEGIQVGEVERLKNRKLREYEYEQVAMNVKTVIEGILDSSPYYMSRKRRAAIVKVMWNLRMHGYTYLKINKFLKSEHGIKIPVKDIKAICETIENSNAKVEDIYV